MIRLLLWRSGWLGLKVATDAIFFYGTITSGNVCPIGLVISTTSNDDPIDNDEKLKKTTAL